MSAIRVRLLVLALLSMCIVGRSAPSSREGRPEPRRGATSAEAAATLTKMPIRFEANAGQHDDGIRFVARRGATSIALRDDGATVAVHQRTAAKGRGHVEQRANRVVVGLKVAGGRTVAPQASEELVTKVSYFTGNDPSKWRTGIPTYAKVTYPSVLEGVDLVYHGEGGALEYDFVVAPGASVSSVAMDVEGASKVSLSDRGELRIHTYAGDIVQPPPVVYQRDARGAKHTIASSYRLVGARSVGFVVSAYDTAKPLVIDPVLAFATYLGGTGYDSVAAVAADAAGNTYVTGSTTSTDFPTANAYDPTFNVYAGCQDCGYTDVYVSKLDPTGTTLLYSTYLGGDASDDGRAIAVAADGTAYVTGSTGSHDFPIVNGINPYRGWDGFVARLSANGGALAYSTYLSGFGYDEPSAIAVDATGIYVAGSSTSTNLGVTLQPQADVVPLGGATGGEDYDAFVAKLSLPGAGGSELLWVRHVGGEGNDFATGLAVDGAGNAYVSGVTGSGFPQTGGALLKPQCQGGDGGSDAFVAKLDGAARTWTYAKCFGGSGEDRAEAIALDASGNVYVTGATSSADFPAPASIYPFAGQDDVFVTKINAAGDAFVYSTFIGGSSRDHAYAIAVDAANAAWITGTTREAETPYPTIIPTQAAHAGGGEGARDAFVSRVNAGGTALIFSSFYGGATGEDEGAAIAVRGSSIHVGGNTYSTDLPFVNGRQQTNAGGEDGFVVRLGVPTLLVAPASIKLDVGTGRQFSAVGGAGVGYVFSLQTNASGASITPAGLYTAGANGGVVDVVRVTDASGLTATATVEVGQPPAALVISPASSSAPPRGQRSFAASGGVAPYAFSLISNASGGLVTSAGTYTAGPKGGVVDVVRLSDAAGNGVSATIVVGPSIAIAPARPAAPPNGALAFSATGGSGSGYTWAITKNGSNGTIGASTGSYTAGSGSSTVDTVQVTDSLGNRASVNVSVGGGLAITPADPVTTTRGAIAFTAVGGSGAYTWSLTSTPSGGTIDAASGAYVAGTTGNSIDTVRVQDSVGNGSSVQVGVGPALTITPAGAEVVAGGTVTFGAAGGSGEGYAFTLATSTSGAELGADGVYTAGAVASSDVVRLSDSLGSTVEATVIVTAAPGILPDGGVPPGFDAGTVPGLNIGGGGIDEDCSCRAVGASSSGAGSAASVLSALALTLGAIRRRRRR
ncbi:MAG: SBBP repeat-containing protein [Labilithrix sp.]|nr:SBBP repeat-containing protein [Labilithrix sp.]